MQTMRNELQSPGNAPLISSSDAEPLNAMVLPSRQLANTMPMLASPGVSGCNLERKPKARISRHIVFVLSKDGTPITPTTPTRAKKLMRAGVAKPKWNKFGKFGIQMFVDTGKKTPITKLGIDPGTKFEGNALVCGKENNLNVMWKLPDKKKIVKKLDDRRILRRARRFRNCRRRAKRFDNRGKNGFITPSQLVVVQSREKCIREFFKCYPITDVAIEDMRFNHSKHRYGSNFSTVEIGKKRIYDLVRKYANLHLYLGMQTPEIREHYQYAKTSSKSAEVFNAHCSDALALVLDINRQERIEPGPFIVVDDTYRSIRRQLHDTQYAKGGTRSVYSTGNFKGIRKGIICKYGQICGGTKNKLYIRNWPNKRTSKAISKVNWLSHKFKTNIQFLSNLKTGVYLV